jgi:hypothetical protein
MHICEQQLLSLRHPRPEVWQVQMLGAPLHCELQH